jgi:regulation of enolase protein 1 (concanavalin A-like superfamily)
MGFEGGAWVNEPAIWQMTSEGLHVVTDKATDFWRETHYGFTRDTGHFFAVTTTGDFTAQMRVRAQYRELYDQAGLMVRISPREWVKAGIELSDGIPMISSVLTIDRSDWATAPYGHDAGDFWLRATVAAGVLRLQVSADGTHWPLMRLCPFPKAPSYGVGPMCCTPERAGLNVGFSDFTIGAPRGKALHDLS